MRNIIRIFLMALLVLTVIIAATSCDLIFDLMMPEDGNDHSACNHVFETQVVDPTCVDRGYDLDTCKLCGAFTYGNYTKPTGHTESEWIIDKEATETELGEKHKECLECGAILEKESVLPHAHDIRTVSAVAPTCISAGHDEYTYCAICGSTTYKEIPAFGHDYSAWASLGNGTHTRVCANDNAHVEIESCVGGEAVGGDLPVCEVCGVEYAFVARLGNSSYGYYALAEYQKGEEMQTLYSAMRATCEEFLFSTETIEKDEDNRYVIGKYDFKELSLTSDEAMGVWKFFYLDNPSYYWLSPVIATVGREIHLSIDGEYATYEARHECDTQIAMKIALCNSLITDDMSDLEVAMTIVSYIVGSMEYAYDDQGNPVEDTWAHNLTGFAMYGYGVCESYTKAFMHLCLLNGVECIVGSGYGGGEKHAWNYIFIDGAWYGADITWTDNSGDAAIYDDFGVADNIFHSEHTLHPNDTFGVDFTYKIPEISETSLELCELLADGESLGIFTSLEEAFAQMLDPAKEYQVNVGYYSFYVDAPDYTLDLEELPRVKKITIIGVNEPAAPGYLDKNTEIIIPADLKLNSTLELSNVDLEGEGKLLLEKNELILSGESVYIRLYVRGLVDGCAVKVEAARGVYFFNGIDIHHLYADGIKVVFGADSHVMYMMGDEIYTMNGAKVTVDNKIH